MKKTFYFNFERLPKKTIDDEVGNALIAFIHGIDIGISEQRYYQLPDWVKTYWKVRP